ncbi:NAD(P)/FAD-dependent oxidoreductase [Arthrobacter sp. Y-9]|uniref:NAD(P)/FAD-dependent oxidoreductase n=1 Tax=Arthrobacter sp. Y-9 TaxID=3039385 RepID=UPI00241DDB74|nr:NAD(P)/FAD-dependent oxidoreductase [Arthrobacter sp. Y-9]WFR84734.1 NAD(P)/FAD-dependent oxidoreductase [Arthrobacter sp. Y-9]
MTTTPYDVAIIGGGPAGLGAAVALGRSRRSVVVIDADEPRNAPAAGAHNVLGLEGIAPADLLARGRTEASSYGVTFLDDAVRTAAHDDGGFLLTVGPARPGGDAVVAGAGETGATQLTTVHARRLLLATGLVDVLPEVPGVRDGWGHSVLHCPYCHGWEVRDRRIGILAGDARAAHQALLFHQLSDQVTLLPGWTSPADGTPGAEWEPGEDAALFEALGIPVASAPVTALSLDGTQVRGAVLADGSSVELDAVVVAPSFVARTELYEQLGGDPEEHPMGRFIPADPTGRTPVPGVWAAGNAQNPMAMVSASSAAGVQAGAAINADLAMDEAARLQQTP